MPARDLRVLHDIARSTSHDARVLGIRAERVATAREKGERPLPLVVRESGVRSASRAPRPATARARSRRRARPSRHAARARRAAARPAAAPRSRRAHRRRARPRPRCSSSAFVGTHVTRLTAPGRWPLRPARCSSRATPLGLPICSTRSTGEKSTPRSSDDVATTQRSRPSRSPVLDPVALRPVERAVMQRDRARPFGARGENRLVPDLRLRSRVGEDDRALAFLDRVDHLRQHLRAEMSGPRKALDHRRNQRVDDHLLSARRRARSTRPVTRCEMSCAPHARRAASRAPGRGCRSSPRAPTCAPRVRACAGARARAPPARRASCPSARAIRRRSRRGGREDLARVVAREQQRRDSRAS